MYIIIHSPIQYCYIIILVESVMARFLVPGRIDYNKPLGHEIRVCTVGIMGRYLIPSKFFLCACIL